MNVTSWWCLHAAAAQCVSHNGVHPANIQRGARWKTRVHGSLSLHVCCAGAGTAAAVELSAVVPVEMPRKSAQMASPPAGELSDAESGELAPNVAAADQTAPSAAGKAAAAGADADMHDGEEGRKRHRERSRWNDEAQPEADSRRSADGRDAREDERWDKRRRREKHRSRHQSDGHTEHRRRRRRNHRESDDSGAGSSDALPGRRQGSHSSDTQRLSLRGEHQAAGLSVPAAPLPHASESLRAQVRAMLQSVRPP